MASASSIQFGRSSLCYCQQGGGACIGYSLHGPTKAERKTGSHSSCKCRSSVTQLLQQAPSPKVETFNHNGPLRDREVIFTKAWIPRLWIWESLPEGQHATKYSTHHNTDLKKPFLWKSRWVFGIQAVISGCNWSLFLFPIGGLSWLVLFQTRTPDRPTVTSEVFKHLTQFWQSYICHRPS